MWRPALPSDDAAITSMCLALNAEDPGPNAVPVEHIERTLRTLRAEPGRGRAMALEVDGRVVGYALLIRYWSNELGGDTITLDEIYVEPAERGRGHGSRLIEDLATSEEGLVALTLEITPENARAR